MSQRKHVPSQVETLVLRRSLRRCCLCFAYEGDLAEKRGQIAHLDHNPANSSERNLVFLCFDHHDRYDGSTRLSKGLTRAEVVSARRELYAHLEARGSRDSTPLAAKLRPTVRARVETEHVRGDEVEISGQFSDEEDMEAADVHIDVRAAKIEGERVRIAGRVVERKSRRSGS